MSQPVRQPAGARALRLPVLLLLALACLVAAAPARAQDRSDTGRRKVPRAVPVEPARPQEATTPAADDLSEAPPFSATTDTWLAGIGLGFGDAGDLFRVETVTGAPVPWGRPGDTDFTASRFTATVDPGSVISAHLARRLGQGRWWLRADLTRGSGDIAAEALLGQGGEVYFYDRATFLAAGLGVEARLTSWPSHPYASLGLEACRLSADRYDDLADTGLGARAALGYRQRLGRGFLGAEVGMSHSGFDINEFRPTVAEEPEPALTYDPAADLWRIEFRVVASRGW